ncbi:MAG: phosphopantothenoylcysteine decarboxylase, partial [Clostridia bacterium]
PAQDVIIQAAAVCDYRVDAQANRKIKKEAGKALTLNLTENPDIAKAVGAKKKKGQTLVGFAAETDHVTENAAEKLTKKKLDLIVANDVTKPGAGFNVDTNIATLITKAGMEELPLLTKRQLADQILDKIIELRMKN